MSYIQDIKDQVGNVVGHVVTYESYAHAWIASHTLYVGIASALAGATVWELIEHTFGLK